MPPCMTTCSNFAWGLLHHEAGRGRGWPRLICASRSVPDGVADRTPPAPSRWEKSSIGGMGRTKGIWMKFRVDW